jgi:hypothetical protein
LRTGCASGDGLGVAETGASSTTITCGSISGGRRQLGTPSRISAIADPCSRPEMKAPLRIAIR